MASASSHITFQNRVKSRRKLRKGTFSCWECKRRKIKCDFQSPFNTACASCRRLGAQCISQEVDEPSQDDCEEAEKRLAQIESFVDQLIQQRSSDLSKAPRHGSLLGTETKEKVTKRKSFQLASTARSLSNLAQHNNGLAPLQWPGIIEQMSNRCISLCAYLHSLLPETPTQALIIAHGKSPFSPHEQHANVQARCLTDIGQTGPTQDVLSVARTLIQLALCLQRLNLNPSCLSTLGLGNSHANIARSFVDATYSVTCYDALIDSLDGVELLLLQSSFETIVGNIKNALLLIRRALTIVQLLDCAQDGVQYKERVRAVWIKLIHFDCILSLMLGKTSFGDSCMLLLELAPTNQSLLSQLEKVHTLAASRIIERNSQMQRRIIGTGSMDDIYNDCENTQNIDRDLKQAMHTLPIQYWHQTAMPVKGMDAQKTIDQLHHFDLLVLVHLPYLITGPHRQQSNDVNGLRMHNTANEYNMLAAACASREVLSRVLMCCNNRDVPCSLSGLWHKSFIASIALLLAQINGHSLDTASILAYQRPSDLRMLHELIDHVEDASSSTCKIPATCSTALLKKLLKFEEHAANGISFCVVSGAEPRQGGNDASDIVDIDFQFTLPYLGIITLRRLDSSPARRVQSGLATQVLNDFTLATSTFEQQFGPFRSQTSVTNALCAAQDLHIDVPL